MDRLYVTKVYISGKISGDGNYKKKFARAETEITNLGNVALNPASLPEGMCQADYMRISLAMLDCADVALFLPDWEESEGAKVEMAYCKKIGKKVIFC